MIASTAAATDGGSAYTLVYFLLGIMGIFGTGGLVAVYGWAKKQGIRDSQQDQVVAVVLPGKDGRGGVVNGLADIGQTAHRTELAVGDIGHKLDEHIGQSREIHTTLDRRLAEQDTVHAAFERRIKKVEGTA